MRITALQDECSGMNRLRRALRRKVALCVAAGAALCALGSCTPGTTTRAAASLLHAEGGVPVVSASANVLSDLACTVVPYLARHTLSANGPTTGTTRRRTTSSRTRRTTRGAPATGVLEGTVFIGPVRNIQRENEPPAPAAREFYTGRSVEVYKTDGVTLVVRTSLGPTGAYRVRLAAGRYLVTVSPPGYGVSKLPREVRITRGHTTHLDLDVDTGIR
jgi:hypothetical protein